MIDKLIRFVVHRPIVVLIPVLLMTLFFGYHAKDIKYDTDIQALIPSGGMVGTFVEHYGEEQNTFDYFVFTITSDNLFHPEGIALFHDTIAQIADMEIFDSPVSPFTFTTFERFGTRLRPAYPAPEGSYPRTEEEMELFAHRLKQDPFAKNLVISEDGNSLAAFFSQPVKVEQYDDYVTYIEGLLEPLEEYYEVHKIGTIFYAAQVQKYLFEDLTRLLMLAVLFMIVLFYSGFRAVRSIVLPILLVGLGTIWSLGAMSLMGFAITVITVSLPPIILALGSSYAIHMLNQHMRDSTAVGKPSKDRSWMVPGIRGIARTISLAGMTTLIGFSSLMFSQIDQIREFGFGAVVGIFTCMILSLTFLPASLSLFRHPKSISGALVHEGKLTKLMARTGNHVLRRHRIYACASILLLISGVILYPRIEQKTDFLEYYPSNDPTILNTEFIVEKFGSFHRIFLTLEAPEDTHNYFLNADVLKSVYEFEQKVQAIPDVGYMSSFPGYIAFMNELMTGNREIPESRGLILTVSRIFKLASVRGMDDVGSFANEDYTELTYTMRLYDKENSTFIYDEDLKLRLTEILGYAEELPDEIETTLWGWHLIFADLADILKHDQNNSLLMSAIGVALISMIFFKSISLGLLALVPLSTGLFITYTCMALLKIPMDMSSAMTASIAIGVGIDDAIHFLIHYRRTRKRDIPVREAVTETIIVTGRPILLTSLAIVGGLMMLVFASFRPVVFFGLLISLALTGACLGTVLVLPSWLLCFTRLKERLTGKREEGTPPQSVQ